MKTPSSSSSAGKLALVLAVSVSLGLAGCESFQKKFTRRKPYERPSPIIAFQDYSRSMTPADRYRKHYALFEYWNAQLLDELQAPNMNAKRAQHASSEALLELKALHGLLQDPVASRLAALIEQRERLNRQVSASSSGASQVGLLLRALETQTRAVHRELYWRRVEDQLKDDAALSGPAAVSSTVSSDAAPH